MKWLCGHPFNFFDEGSKLHTYSYLRNVKNMSLGGILSVPAGKIYTSMTPEYIYTECVYTECVKKKHPPSEFPITQPNLNIFISRFQSLQRR